MKKVTLNVNGIHCNSCKIFLEDVLNEQTQIEDVNVDIKNETVSFNTSLDGSNEKIAKSLSEILKDKGYCLSTEKKLDLKNEESVFWPAFFLGLTLLFLFFLLQKSGILNFGLGGSITPITSFIIGLVASVSSCLAVVGGLVLSLSATASKDSLSDTKPILSFHLGRILGFAFLGGILGITGSLIGINFTLTSILGIIASLIMIILGFNLVGIFKKLNITISPKIFRFFQKIEHKSAGPFVLGIGTFFLPCGFTQSMQVVAISTGSFMSGLFIMLAFALGTFPVLALLSFGYNKFSLKTKHSYFLFKTVGVVVIGLGLFSFLTGLAAVGFIEPIFNI